MLKIGEEGWVVCRVFKKKYHRGFQPTEAAARGAGNHLDDEVDDLTLPPADYHSQRTMMARGIKQVMHHHEILQSSSVPYNSCNPAYDGHLPQLFSPEAVIPNLNITSSNSINGSNNNDLLEGSHNLLRLTPSSNGSTISSMYGGPSDWSFLDKLLGSTSHPPQQHPALGNQGKASAASFPYPSSCSQGGVMDGASCTAAAAQPPPHHTLFPFQFQGCSSSSADLLFKFPK
ncbi:hypothetical protein SAY86_004800 [Trapa natans]|uniref:Uncharacterized protein n=1 Tax=Trapa natans TaxID=22666 RepID=A0AAN7N792_TRANT|nr:hypothetical protein SAY86_004800 [Trapa natans]